MPRHSVWVNASLFSLALGTSSGASVPASPSRGERHQRAPEILQPYAPKAPLVRVDFLGVLAFFDPDKIRPWLHVSVYDDGFVAYFVHPCGDKNGIRTKRLTEEQVAAIVALSRRACDTLVSDWPRIGCTDSPTTLFACVGSGGFRKLDMTCANGDRRRSGGRFMNDVLALAGLTGIDAPIAQACLAAASDPVAVPQNNPFEMATYFREPPAAAGDVRRDRR
jgi:hypothetical protein